MSANHFTGLHHVRVPVSDLATSRRFWEDAMGYKWDFDFGPADSPDGVGLRSPAGGPNVVLWLAPAIAAASAGFTQLGIGVPDHASLERMRDRLDALGVRHGGIQSAFVDAKLPGVCMPGGAMLGLYVKPEGATGPAPSPHRAQSNATPTT